MVRSINQDPETEDQESDCTVVDEAQSCEQRREISIKAGSDDPTDGRLPFDWKSRYDKKAQIEIYFETFYLLLLLTLGILFIFFSWNKWLPSILCLTQDELVVFKKYIYYSMAALLGGVVFAFKNLYKSVARGWWHQDRRIWRGISPILAMVVGFVVGAMVESNMLSSTSPVSSPGMISIGFLSGYFADRAIGKMREIAAVIFGKSATSKNDGKQER